MSFINFAKDMEKVFFWHGIGLKVNQSGNISQSDIFIQSLKNKKNEKFNEINPDAGCCFDFFNHGNGPKQK